MKTALTIAGSDSSGGAGIQADLKTFSVLGVYGMSAITAVTAQNTLGVKESFELSPDLIRKQIDVTAGDIPADATKSGMLASAAVIEVVEDCIQRNKLQPYVLDPVMAAKSGDSLLKKDAIEAMIARLFPLATVVTPNLNEVAAVWASLFFNRSRSVESLHGASTAHWDHEPFRLVTGNWKLKTGSRSGCAPPNRQ